MGNSSFKKLLNIKYLILMIRPGEVFNSQRCCRSAVEDPDMSLCRNPSCRTLRVPTYELTCLTHFKLQRAGSIMIRPCEVFNSQRCCRSAVEDPDMSLCRNPSCRTLRVPTCELTLFTHFKLQRAGSIACGSSRLWRTSLMGYSMTRFGQRSFRFMTMTLSRGPAHLKHTLEASGYLLDAANAKALTTSRAVLRSLRGKDR